MLSRTWQWHSVSGVGGRGGNGRQLSPFHPAQLLIELDCRHLPVLCFPEKNFALVSAGSKNSQRSFHACDHAQRWHLYFFRPGRFSVILSPRMILTRLNRLPG